MDDRRPVFVVDSTHDVSTGVRFVACNLETLEAYMTKQCTLLEAYDEGARKIESSGSREYSEAVQGIQALQAQIRLDFVLQDLGGLFEDSQDGLQRVTNIMCSLRDSVRSEDPEEASIGVTSDG